MVLLCLVARADEGQRLARIGSSFGSLVVHFETDPQGAELWVGDRLQGMAGSGSGDFLIARQAFASHPLDEPLPIRFHRPGYADATARMSWRELEKLAALPGGGDGRCYRLRPQSLGAWWERYPLPLTLLGLALTAGLGLGMRRFLRARRRQAWESRLAALTASADCKDPMILRRLGRFRLVQRLGAGGMATVYRGVPEETLEEAESVAIKMVKTEEWSPEYLDRFDREIQVSMKLNHPNVVRVVDWGEQDGLPYLAMEFLRARTLSECIPPGGMDSQTALAVVESLTEALAYAHEMGIVHRDLKPANVMMTERGVLKLMDFGLARDHRVATITQTGHAMGTPAYIPPEAITARSGPEHLTPLSDQYSYGVMLYEIFCGRRPFEDTQAVRILLMHMTAVPPGVRVFRPELPAPLEKALLRMLERDPQARFASIRDAGRAVASALQGVRFPARWQAPAPPDEDETQVVSGN